jgi:hypothetical protein
MLDEGRPPCRPHTLVHVERRFMVVNRFVGGAESQREQAEVPANGAEVGVRPNDHTVAAA